MSATRGKEQKLSLVAEAILRIIHPAGIQSLNHSRLARRAGVSRAWLYKYVGKNREELLGFAVDYFGVLLADLKRPEVGFTPEQWLEEALLGFGRLLSAAEQFPSALVLWFQYRGTHGVLGRKMAEIDRRHSEREVLELTRIFGLTQARAAAISEVITCARLASAHGWSNADSATRVSREELLRAIEKMLRGALSPPSS